MSTAAEGPELGNAKFTIGTLVYSKAGLFMLFGWLLWGDFCFTLFETIGGPSILGLYLQDNFRVSNKTINIMFNIIPMLIGVIVGPILSFKSDRRRGPVGPPNPVHDLDDPLPVLLRRRDRLFRRNHEFRQEPRAAGRFLLAPDGRDDPDQFPGHRLFLLQRIREHRLLVLVCRRGSASLHGDASWACSAWWERQRASCSMSALLVSS